MARVEQRFEPSLAAPGQARHFVDGALLAWERVDLREDAELLTGEIVADALRQQPSQVALLIEPPTASCASRSATTPA